MKVHGKACNFCKIEARQIKAGRYSDSCPVLQKQL